MTASRSRRGPLRIAVTTVTPVTPQVRPVSAGAVVTAVTARPSERLHQKHPLTCSCNRCNRIPARPRSK